MVFAEKLKKLRKESGLTLDELAAECGTSRRSLVQYEQGVLTPHGKNMQRIADYFRIAPDILTDENAELPKITSLEESYVSDIRSKYGEKAAADMSELFSSAAAFFAGGELPQEEKDKFLKAMNKAYIRCREESEKRSKKEQH